MLLCGSISPHLRRRRLLAERTARWHPGLKKKKMTAHFNSQICASLKFGVMGNPQMFINMFKCGLNITLLDLSLYNIVTKKICPQKPTAKNVLNWISKGVLRHIVFVANKFELGSWNFDRLSPNCYIIIQTNFQITWLVQKIWQCNVGDCSPASWLVWRQNWRFCRIALSFHYSANTWAARQQHGISAKVGWNIWNWLSL